MVNSLDSSYGVVTVVSVEVSAVGVVIKGVGSGVLVTFLVVITGFVVIFLVVASLVVGCTGVGSGTVVVVGCVVVGATVVGTVNNKD